MLLEYIPNYKKVTFETTLFCVFQSTHEKPQPPYQRFHRCRNKARLAGFFIV